MSNPGYAAVVSRNEIALVIDDEKIVVVDRPSTYDALLSAIENEAPLADIKRIAELD